MTQPIAADDPAATPLAASRAALMVVGVVLACVVTTAVAGPAAPVVIGGWLKDGALIAGWLFAAWGFGAPIARRVAPASDDAAATLHHLTGVALGLGLLSLITLALGWAGALGTPTAWMLLLAGVACGLVQARLRVRSLNDWLGGSAGAAWLALLAVPAIAFAGIAARILPGILWGDEPHGYDVASYHLQLPREWLENGRVVPLTHNVFSFFPLNVEMHALLAMHLRGGAHAGMYLAQIMCGAFALLVPLAAYAIARSRGRLAGAAALIVCASAPWITMLGGVAYNEGGLMLFATLAAAWALRGRWFAAGLLAGFAAGCKYTGVTSAILLVPIVVAVCSQPLTRAESGKIRITKTLIGVIVFVAAALLTFSPWLIRNAVHAGGNPVFPLALRTLGAAHFDDGQIERFEVAHAPRDDQRALTTRASALWQQVGREWRYAAIPIGETFAIPTLFLLAAVTLACRLRDREAWAWTLLIVGNVGVWLFATHLQGRFLVQVIPCAAILCATARWRWQPAAVIGVAFVAGAIAHREPASRLTDERYLNLVELTDLRPLWDDDVRLALDDAPRPLALLGDQRPFFFPVEMSRLRYRTVFDVPSDRPFRDAWLGADLPGDVWAIITAAELQRLSQTYRRLPPVPASVATSPGITVIPAAAVARE